MKYDLPSDQTSINNYKRYQELTLKGDTRTSAENTELANLQATLANYLVTAMDFNNKLDTSSLLNAVKNIDGAGSGIDADLIQGVNAKLIEDDIKGTTQTATYTGNDITKVEYKLTASPYTTIRTDNITYTSTKTTEVRTLNTGETITIETNFDGNGNFINEVIS